MNHGEETSAPYPGGSAAGGRAGRRLRRTGGRVRLGPATLYTILDKFLTEGYLEEIAVEGRKRTYRLTEAGLMAYHRELGRLRRCLEDAERTDAEEGGL